MQSITKLQERQSGRISSIFYQYKTNDQVDNHWPCTITISGGVPLSSITVAPPLQKPCISSSSSKPASFQMVLHLPMNPSFVKGSQWSVVTKEKNGAFSGTLTLTQRWWWMAGRGFLISLDAVSVMRAPSLWVVFFQGIQKLSHSRPVVSLSHFRWALQVAWYFRLKVLHQTSLIDPILSITTASILQCRKNKSNHSVWPPLLHFGLC